MAKTTHQVLACATIVLVGFTPATVHGHGALITPPSRNAVDRFLPQFQDGAFKTAYYGCNCGNQSGVGCSPGTRSNMNGQPCLWFSQGCTIGCNTCDNETQHTMGKQLCEHPTQEPTLPRYAWTMNRWVVEGSVNDTYRYHPWRAPGHAPVVDACGMAGGSPHQGGGAAVFLATQYAKQGDLGTDVLKPAPSNTVWKAGSTAEVSWGIRANHGGGYQFRLCPASEKLTEDCFQRIPLAFASTEQALLYTNGDRVTFPGVFVSEGTKPAGSTWAMNPIPRIDFDSQSSGQPKGWTGCVAGNKSHDTSFPTTLPCRQFKSAACDDGPGEHPWHPIPGKAMPTGDVEGKCSGDFISAAIVDTVVVPKDMAPGEYVLGWRWDCEETAQIWSSCADITITA